MNYLKYNWCVQIDITTLCPEKCVYCTRFIGHLRQDQRRNMTVEQFEKALLSLQGWPQDVGIIGGEPLLHPQLGLINTLIRKHIPQNVAHIFTALPAIPEKIAKTQVAANPDSQYHWEPSHVWSRWPADDPELTNTYGTICYNPHTQEKMAICRHHPGTIAIGEAVSNPSLMWKLINNCFVQRLWSPTINIHGAYFCEVAASLDMILFDGLHAWSVEPGWWKRPPEHFQEQVAQLCVHCGMCLPMERQPIGTKKEQITPNLLERMKEKDLKRLSGAEVEIFTGNYNKEDVIKAAKTWYPANYRDDLFPDEEAPQSWLGLQVPLNFDPADPGIFHLDTEDEFAEALKRVGHTSFTLKPLNELPVFSFFYGGYAFNPLKEQYPFVLPDREKENTLYIRGLLLYFRYFMDNAAFQDLCGEERTREWLLSLAPRLRCLSQTVVEQRIQQAGKELAGKKAYFWGAGAAYEAYKKYFAEVQPACLIMTLPKEKHPDAVDGIPVCCPEEAFVSNEKLLFVVFAREEHMGIFSEIVERFSHFADGGIIWCTLKEIPEC